MLVSIGLIVALLAAALHLLIFYMESLAWEGTLARKTFGGTAEEARPHRFYAFNQGFYNLFLAIEVLLGAALAQAGEGGARVVGLVLVAFGCASMLGAALALGIASRGHRVAALKQGTLPALALVVIGVGLL